MMSRPGACALLTLLVCLVAPASAHAQARRDPMRTSVAAGLGLAGSAETDGFGGLVQLAWQREPHQVSVRFVGFADLFSTTSVNELGALYGRVITGSAGHMSINAGLGAAFRCSGSASSCDREQSVSVPIAAEAALRLLPVAGIGVQAFASFNSVESMGGLLLFLQLGWLPR